MTAKRINWKAIAEKRAKQCTILFILFLCMAGVCFHTFYRFEIEDPKPYDDKECKCFHWGCYCCKQVPHERLVYDLKKNISNLALYWDCSRQVQLPGVALNVELTELKCNELRDYYENGRRCQGIWPETCVYPKIKDGWVTRDQRKAALAHLMLEKGCTFE